MKTSSNIGKQPKSNINKNINNYNNQNVWETLYKLFNIFQNIKLEW